TACTNDIHVHPPLLLIVAATYRRDSVCMPNLPYSSDEALRDRECDNARCRSAMRPRYFGMCWAAESETRSLNTGAAYHALFMTVCLLQSSQAFTIARRCCQ